MEIAALFGQLVANGNSFATVYLRPGISVLDGTQIVNPSAYNIPNNCETTVHVVNKETQDAYEDVEVSEKQKESSSDDEQNSNDSSSVSSSDKVEDENCIKNKDDKNQAGAATQRIR